MLQRARGHAWCISHGIASNTGDLDIIAMFTFMNPRVRVSIRQVRALLPAWWWLE